jgi:hypothetical protein
MKVMAVDVGLVNCSFCVLDSTGACVPDLQYLHDRLEDGSVAIERLDLIKLGANKHAAAAATFDNVISFLESCAATDAASVDVIVIETQMTARMKAIAASFYTASRCLFPGAKVLFQSATAKLNFADLATYSETPVATATYAQRKKASVVVAKKLTSANVRPEIRQAFLKAKKKDDLSDALLHALAALCTHGKIARPKAKARGRGRPPLPAQSMEEVGANT